MKDLDTVCPGCGARAEIQVNDDGTLPFESEGANSNRLWHQCFGGRERRFYKTIRGKRYLPDFIAPIEWSGAINPDEVRVVMEAR